MMMMRHMGGVLCIVIAGHVGFLLEQDQVAAAHIRELPVLS